MEGAKGVHVRSKAGEIDEVAVDEGDWSDSRNREAGRGYQPTQDDSRKGGFARRKATGPDEIDTHRVKAGKVVGSSAVGVGSGVGKAKKKIGVTVG